MPTVSVSVDVSGMQQLGERLQELAETVPARLKQLFTECAEFTAVEARELAQGSKKTVDTIKVIEVPGPVSSAVQAGSGVSPLPALRERGSRSRPGPTWRHPVYGTNAWVKQEIHPYLAPAMLSTRAANLQRMSDGVEVISNEVIGEQLPE